MQCMMGGGDVAMFGYFTTKKVTMQQPSGGEGEGWMQWDGR